MRSPGCRLSDEAYSIMADAIALYDEGSARIRPTRTMVIIEKLQLRAQHALESFKSKSKDRQGDEPQNVEADTISFLGGKHGFIRKSESPGPSTTPPVVQEVMTPSPTNQPVDPSYGYNIPSSSSNGNYIDPIPQFYAGIQYADIPYQPSSFFDPTYGSNTIPAIPQSQPTHHTTDGYYPVFNDNNAVNPMAEYSNFFPGWDGMAQTAAAASHVQTMSPQHNFATWSSFMEDLMGEVNGSS